MIDDVSKQKQQTNTFRVSTNMPMMAGATTKRMNTPLHKLIEQGGVLEKQKIMLLLDVTKDEHLYTKNEKYGALPIHLVCRFVPDRTLIQKILDLAPSTLFEKDDYNRTVLHYYACCGKKLSFGNVGKYLVERFNKLNLHDLKKQPLESTQDVDGNLPLHLASRYNASIETITWLCATYPEGVSMRNYNGAIPAYLAKTASDEDTSEILMFYARKYPTTTTTLVKEQHKINTTVRSIDPETAMDHMTQQCSNCHCIIS